jgi:hypothetical protein
MLGSSMAVRAVGGEINGVLTIATDITDLLASEEAHEELVAELLMVERRERERSRTSFMVDRFKISLLCR